MSKILDKIKSKVDDLVNAFHCQACGKKCDNREQAKYNIYLEKWFEKEAKSATEVKLCAECAAPIVDVVKKAKAFAALKRKDIDIDPNKGDKPYHFGD